MMILFFKHSNRIWCIFVCFCPSYVLLRCGKSNRLAILAVHTQTCFERAGLNMDQSKVFFFCQELFGSIFLSQEFIRKYFSSFRHLLFSGLSIVISKLLRGGFKSCSSSFFQCCHLFSFVVSLSHFLTSISALNSWSNAHTLSVFLSSYFEATVTLNIIPVCSWPRFRASQWPQLIISISLPWPRSNFGMFAQRGVWLRPLGTSRNLYPKLRVLLQL